MWRHKHSLQWAFSYHLSLKYHGRSRCHEQNWKVCLSNNSHLLHPSLPLESSFLKRCVPISCCSGELEKIIWVISSEITPPFGPQIWRFIKIQKKCSIKLWTSCVCQWTARFYSWLYQLVWCLFSSYHDWVHVVSLGLQVSTISHPIIFWDTIILHCGNISPFKKLQH